MDTVFERVQGILINKFSLEPERITPEATIESLGLDSLDFIDVLFDVEDEFKIRVPQEGSSTLRTTTLQDIVNNIEKLLAEQEQSAPPHAAPQAAAEI